MSVAMGGAGSRRVSHIEMKSVQGFRAELSGLELGTLIRLTCTRRERMVVRVSSYGEEGYLYSAAGRVVHATLGELVGEEAVLRMLGWRGGDFAVCELPFPETASIQRSTEGLIALATQRADESALDEVLTAAPSAPADESVPLRESSLPPPALLPTPSTRTSAPPPLPSRVTPLPRELVRARSLPPPPPPNARRPFLHGEPIHDAALIASVRVDGRGALLSSFGNGDQLAQLVAYIAHVVGLIQADFALDAFEALHAELSGQRMLIFQEAGDIIGLLMQPGQAAQELRQRLGV